MAAEPVVSFVEQVARRCEEWAAQVRAAGCPRDESQSRLRAGGTWIDTDRMEPDPVLGQAVLRSLVDDLRPASGPVPHALRRVEDAIAAGRLSALPMLRAVLDRDDTALDGVARQAGVPTQVLHFLGAYLARPFLSAASRAFDPALENPERHGSACPVCGHEAALGFFLPDTGQRRLWCRYCGNGWPVTRLRCPFCSNSEGDSLGYFEIEGMPGRRVDFCRRCMRYLKTMDLRDAAAGDVTSQADLMDLTSAELDDAAMQEGFTHPLPAGGPVEPDRKA